MELTPTRGSGRGIYPLQRQINRLFDDFFGEEGWPYGRGRETLPSVDLAESEDEYVITAEVPGVDPEDLDISVTGNTLTLSGEKKNVLEEKARKFHRVERRYGAFQRMLTLPADVDPEAVSAACRDGVLTVHVGKKEEAKPRSIQVKLD